MNISFKVPDISTQLVIQCGDKTAEELAKELIFTGELLLRLVNGECEEMDMPVTNPERIFPSASIKYEYDDEDDPDKYEEYTGGLFGGIMSFGKKCYVRCYEDVVAFAQTKKTFKQYCQEQLENIWTNVTESDGENK